MFKRLFRRQEGIGLVETLASLAIGGVVTAGLVAAMFQINLISRVQGDSLNVAGQVQNAMAMLNHDLMSATTGNVADGENGETMTLHKPTFAYGQDSSVVTSTITYQCVAGDLVRDDGSNVVTVARDVSAVDFGPTGQLQFTTVITITSQVRDATVTKSVTINRRPDSIP